MSDDEHLLDIWPGARHRHPDEAGEADAPDRPEEPGAHEDFGAHEQPGAYGEHRDSAAHTPRRARPRRRRTAGKLLSVVVLLVIVAVLAAGGYVGYHRVKASYATPDYPGPGTGSVTVVVKQGDTAGDIAATMASRAVVKSAKAFRTAAENNPKSVSIQPGTYRLREHMKGTAALALLLDPASRLLLRFTVPEGFTVAQTLARIARDTSIPLADLKAAAARPKTLGLPSWAHNRLEGLLFPATYDLEPGASASQALKAMVAKFTQEAAASDLLGLAGARHISPYDLLIVASIAEKEGVTDDFGKISRVVYNRLAAHQRLQLDSTLNYVLHQRTGHPSAAQTKTVSPYNTYQVAGLPPTPISNPGLTSLRAAGSPPAGPWLYFVTISKDGHSFFTDSYPAFVARKQQAQRDGVY